MAAKRLRIMTRRERCLMMKMVIYAEEELQEVSIEYQDMWEYMEEIFMGERNAMLAKKVGKSTRGEGNSSRCVAAGLQQPHNHHDTPFFKLSWYWVRQGSSCPT